MKYLVSRHNVDIVKNICKRDQISYRITKSDNKKDYMFDMDITRARFRELIADMKCEQRRMHTKTQTPYVTANTIHNPCKFHMILGDNNKFRITLQELNKL